MFYNVSNKTSREVIAPRLVKRRGIVVHTSDGWDSLTYLQGGSLLDGRKVSSDYLISRAGLIYMITPPGWYAFHTGTARWNLQQDDDRTLNKSFVGVELEWKQGANQAITAPQYIALAWLLRRLCTDHAIDLRNVVGHYQVALPAGRKQDPLTLNWGMLTVELINPSVEQSLYEYKGEVS